MKRSGPTRLKGKGLLIDRSGRSIAVLSADPDRSIKALLLTGGPCFANSVVDGVDAYNKPSNVNPPKHVDSDVIIVVIVVVIKRSFRLKMRRGRVHRPQFDS